MSQIDGIIAKIDALKSDIVAYQEKESYCLNLIEELETQMNELMCKDVRQFEGRYFKYRYDSMQMIPDIFTDIFKIIEILRYVPDMDCFEVKCIRCKLRDKANIRENLLQYCTQYVNFDNMIIVSNTIGNHNKYPIVEITRDEFCEAVHSYVFLSLDTFVPNEES